MPKAALAFTGCKLNRYELQSISESLEACGFELVPFDNQADLYIINTCGVTGKAEVSSKQLVRRARRIGPDARIVVTGCYADLKSGEVRELGADLVVPNMEKEYIGARVADLMGLEISSIPESADDLFGSRIISGMGDLTRGFVKLQEGCARKCSYCTIWRSRGPVRSRKPGFIVEEINRLYENGYKEIVLTGVHIGMYSAGDLNFSGLLKSILPETSISRIRLSSLYPTEIDDTLIGLFADEKRICPYVHISVQSGDDAILKAMGRRYDRDSIISICGRLKAAVPEITIGADIIVGFPGETTQAFENTKDLVEKADIHHLHVFSFSPRPGTPAADMTGQIDPPEMKRRTSTLRQIGRRQKTRHLVRFIGQELEALIENRETSGNLLTGLTGNYLRIETSGDEVHKGRIIKVRPYDFGKETLLSDII